MPEDARSFNQANRAYCSHYMIQSIDLDIKLRASTHIRGNTPIKPLEIKEEEIGDAMCVCLLQALQSPLHAPWLVPQSGNHLLLLLHLLFQGSHLSF